MMKSMHMKLIGTALVVLVASSCAIGLNPETTTATDEIESLDAVIGVSAESAIAAADAQLGVSGSVSGSTTYNFSDSMSPVAVTEGATETLPVRSNYPYPGWQTTGTVEHIAWTAWSDYDNTSDWSTSQIDSIDTGTDGNNLFKVTAIATPTVSDTYPESEVTEVYYVVSDDDNFDSSDYIFDPYGYTGGGYRDSYVADYADGSSRNHYVQELSGSSALAELDINGSLDFATVAASRPSTDSSAEYSSLVLYTHDLGQTYNYWFWNNNDAVDPTIIGWRYYTEHVVGSELIGTSLSIEYTYNADPNREADAPVLLARTIIREEMRFAWNGSQAGDATSHSLRMRTEINNSSGGADLVYTKNGRAITDWRSSKAQANQLDGVQRDALPSGYSNFASEVDTVLTDIEG